MAFLPEVHSLGLEDTGWIGLAEVIYKLKRLVVPTSESFGFNILIYLQLYYCGLYFIYTKKKKNNKNKKTNK